MTFNWLMQAVAFEAHNVQVHSWKTKESMDSYLQVCLVPKKIRYKVWETLHSTKNRESKEEVPSVIPYIWSFSTLMTTFLEFGMHHILKGIVADCIIVMVAFMTHHKLYLAFK